MSMDPRLKEAAQTGNFNHFYSLIDQMASLLKDIDSGSQTGNFSHFYSLIEEKASLLRDIDTESFAETPLHVAAYEGQIAFAIEMMNLRPAFARTLNKAGFSPMHVALQNGKTHLVYRLLKMDKDLVRVKGREGKTPFHHAVEQGDEQLLSVFLEACPECIQDVTVHNDTALHIALKCDKFKVFESLVKWIRNCLHKDASDWEESVLNWKDEQGNTPLHIAAIKNSLEAVNLLSVDNIDILDVHAKNLEDLTALQYISKWDVNDETNINDSQVGTRSAIISILQKQGAGSILNFLDCRILVQPKELITLCKRINIQISRGRKNISEDMRNALLVVMTLIITATYQSALSPPGGVWSGDNRSCSSIASKISASSNNTIEFAGELQLPGTAVMQKNTFSVLWTYNTLSLLITIGLTVYMLPGGPVAFILFAPLSLLCSSYMLSMSILSPTAQWSRANRILSVVIYMLLIVPSYFFIYRRLRLKDRQFWRFTKAPQPRNLLASLVIDLVIGLSIIAFRTAKLL